MLNFLSLAGHSPRFARIAPAPSFLPSTGWSAALLLLLLPFVPGLQAQTAITSDVWNAPSTWDNSRVPGAGDNVVIDSGNTVTLDVGSNSLGILKVGNSGDGALDLAGNSLFNTFAQLGFSGGSTGTVTVSLGSLWINSNNLTVGNNGTGLLTISGGTITAPTVQLATAGSGAGTINLNGGVLASGQVIRGGGSGSGQLNFNGGVLSATANAVSFISGFGTGDVQIASGGATINSNGHNIGIATVIQGAGGLTKQGGGTLTISADNTYAGTTTISAGTLQLGAGGASGSVAGNVADKASLVFNRSGTATYAGNISGIGSVQQAGPGTLVLTGSNTYTGATTINSGTCAAERRRNRFARGRERIGVAHRCARTSQKDSGRRCVRSRPLDDASVGWHRIIREERCRGWRVDSSLENLRMERRGCEGAWIPRIKKMPNQLPEPTLGSCADSGI